MGLPARVDWIYRADLPEAPTAASESRARATASSRVIARPRSQAWAKAASPSWLWTNSRALLLRNCEMSTGNRSRSPERFSSSLLV